MSAITTTEIQGCLFQHMLCFDLLLYNSFKHYCHTNHNRLRVLLLPGATVRGFASSPLAFFTAGADVSPAAASVPGVLLTAFAPPAAVSGIGLWLVWLETTCHQTMSKIHIHHTIIHPKDRLAGCACIDVNKRACFAYPS